jgi:hypothetical protein
MPTLPTQASLTRRDLADRLVSALIDAAVDAARGGDRIRLEVLAQEAVEAMCQGEIKPRRR